MLLRSIPTVAASGFLAVGCGGNGQSASPPTTNAPPPTSATFPNLGCDVVSVCLPDWIRDTLADCSESELSNEGKQARRRLEELLPRVRFGEPAPGHQDDHDAAIDALQVVWQSCHG